METLAVPASASSDTESEINLLLVLDRTEERRRWRSAAAASILVHAFIISGLLLMPALPVESRVYRQPGITRLTPLYTPPDLTQKAPNKGKLSKELSAESIAPRPLVRAPSPAPAVQRVLPPPQVAKAEPKPLITEPPKLQVESPNAPTPQNIVRFTPPPPPQTEQPKLVLETPQPPKAAPQGKPAGGIAIPNTSVEAAIKSVARSGLQSGQSVGDIGADEGGAGLGLNLPPSAGRPRSNLELKSDPMGVDFRPYMLQVLAAVRRNWFAVYPEAARLGQRGQVVLEFAIAKQGAVTKVIFSTESGAKALDQSAVAAISASNPLPPLPADFRGERIVLRMTFMYNMAR